MNSRFKNKSSICGPLAQHYNAIMQFEALAVQLGFKADFKAEADGILHRVPVEQDKRGRRSGWYVLFTDGVPAGRIGNWITGQSQSWYAKSSSKMTSAEAVALRARIEAAKASQRQQVLMRQQAAARRAEEIWAMAAPCNSHPYLTLKHISNHGARVLAWPQGFFDPTTGKRDRNLPDALVIPMRDIDGTLCSLAAIAADGRKDFLFGGRKRGCYYTIGELHDTVCITEGFATGASIFEATGHAVVVAFDCGNLLAVAMALRAKYPHIRIVVCADDDRNTVGNPGLTKATEAARAVRGFLAVPKFKKGNA